MSLSNKSYEELEKASQDWANWHKKVIILDEGRFEHFHVAALCRPVHGVASILVFSMNIAICDLDQILA